MGVGAYIGGCLASRSWTRHSGTLTVVRSDAEAGSPGIMRLRLSSSESKSARFVLLPLREPAGLADGE